MKEDIPKIVITSRFFNTVKLFKQLEELEEFVNVDFTEDGMIPEYIEFDKQDILFSVENILRSSCGIQIAILKGITIRIVADAYIDDLVLLDTKEVIILLP